MSHNAPQAALCRPSQHPCVFQPLLSLALQFRKSSNRSCDERNKNMITDNSDRNKNTDVITSSNTSNTV